MLPVSHTTQKAQITIVIDGEGNFLRASIVPKQDSRTVIPATEESAGRTSGITPHPLCDKLQYIAGDYAQYGGEKEAGYELYTKLLSQWIHYDANQQKLKAILNYVRKGSVVFDLVRCGVLHTEAENSQILLNQWIEEEVSPEIFKLLPGGFDNKNKHKPWQADAFVRWSVETPEAVQSDVWTDKELWKSWQGYYENTGLETGLCYVLGKEVSLAKQHPAKIRNDGDKAKLISSNDSSGFTFRGRFISSEEACGVGFGVTQKAHNALRWLIGRQGWRDGDQAVVAWAVSGAEVPDPLADTWKLVEDELPETAPNTSTGYTAQQTGIALSRKIAGYAADLTATDRVVVMGLDSATPGRMAMTFYRELSGSDFLARVEAWHTRCSWVQRFGKDKIFIGAPAPRDIAGAAYGKVLDNNKKLQNSAVERLLPCIVDGAPIPRDFVECSVRNATNRNGIEYWRRKKTLGIACALYRYQHRERNYAMALERDRTTRDYLYGRLLALAEHLEERALFIGGEQRETNAGKLMQRFAGHPYSTWISIETALTPSKVRLRSKRPGFLHAIETEMDGVMSLFKTDDYISDQRLTGEFLLGYHCQRSALRPSEGQEIKDKENEMQEK